MLCRCAVREGCGVLHAFLDESYTDSRYYMGAVVVDDAHLSALQDWREQVMAYATGFGVDPGVEIHAHRLMSARSGWEPLERQFRAKVAIYGRALNALSATGAVCFLEGVDVTRLRARYRYPDRPHEIVLRHLLERVDRYARTVEHQQVTVLCDDVSEKVDYTRIVADLAVTGTPGYRPSTLAAVQQPIGFADSRLHPGLQAADALVYLYRRHDGHDDSDRTKREVEKLWTAANGAVRNHRVWLP